MPIAKRIPFQEPFRGKMLRALYRQGHPWHVVERALLMWEANVKVFEVPCEEEAKGKEYGLATECKCDGCVTRRCFAFFDQVRTNFGIPDIDQY